MSRSHREFAKAVLAEINHTLFGLDDVTRLCLAALYTEGHVLLEGNPGLGKTELVKTLSRTLKLPFKRIQFTPDLMPADITGSLLPDRNDINRLTFQPGPVFTNLLLADEINRATPKTQSAMLQAMAEKEVTVLGEDYLCPQPFMVLATQNPIDHEGTYTLPEAQSDRFMFQINMPTPRLETVQRILAKTSGTPATPLSTTPNTANPDFLPTHVDQAIERFISLRNHILESSPQAVVQDHVTNMFLAGNNAMDELIGLHQRQIDLLKSWQHLWNYGPGPRAVTALMRGAKAWSALFLEDADKADGRALAKVVLPALRHRVRLTFEWTDIFRGSLRMDDQRPIDLNHFVTAYFMATAPRDRGYHAVLRTGIGGTLCPELKSLKIIE